MIGALMYRIPTEEELANMSESFPFVVAEPEVPRQVFRSYTIVRRDVQKPKATFFKFEGRKDNDIISVFQLESGIGGTTGNDKWDDMNRTLAVKTLIDWALKSKATELIVHTHNDKLFESLWDLGLKNFDLGKGAAGVFTACGMKKLSA